MSRSARSGAAPGTGSWDRSWQRRLRLERQLHDGASLRISALSLRLGLLRRHSRDEAFQRDVGELQDELHLVLDELRAVAGEIYPPLLEQAGLGPALRELAHQRGVSLTVDAPDERFGAAVEGAAYFAVAEAATRPDGADAGHGALAVTVRREDNWLVVVVHGVPGCHAEPMADHVEAWGGRVAHDGGTTTVRIPCE